MEPLTVDPRCGPDFPVGDEHLTFPVDAYPVTEEEAAIEVGAGAVQLDRLSEKAEGLKGEDAEEGVVATGVNHEATIPFFRRRFTSARGTQLVPGFTVPVEWGAVLEKVPLLVDEEGDVAVVTEDILESFESAGEVLVDKLVGGNLVEVLGGFGESLRFH